MPMLTGFGPHQRGPKSGQDKLADLDALYCAKVYEHVRHREERYWKTDLMIDEEIEIEDDEGSPF